MLRKWVGNRIYIYITYVVTVLPRYDMIWLINYILTIEIQFPSSKDRTKHSKTIVTNQGSRKSSPLEPLIHRPWNPHLPRRNSVSHPQSESWNEFDSWQTMANHRSHDDVEVPSSELNRDFYVFLEASNVVLLET